MGVNEELCKYLKSNNFKEFMELWKEKYEKYGRCGGFISVPLNDNNRICISLFMGKNYHKQSHAKIHYSTLKKSIESTKFQGADFNEVLFMYYDKTVIYHKDLKQIKEEKFDNFYNDILNLAKKDYSINWLKTIYETNDTSLQRIKYNYFKAKATTFNNLKDVIALIDNLPVFNNTYENFTIFVSKYTNDPHSFDNGTFNYFLFFKALSFIFNDREYDKNELLEKARLYNDLTNNYISVFNMVGVKDNKIHEGWKIFYENHEMMNFNIDNLYHIDAISDKYTSRIYVVENPSIFQMLAKVIKDNGIKDVGLVCTYGQLKLAAYLILDRISKIKCEIYYGGDFDPEGLLIAQKVIDSNPKVNLWHYDSNDYFDSKSDKNISTRRMNSLDKLVNQKLIDIAECIKIDNKAGYQENIIDKYIGDILNTK